MKPVKEKSRWNVFLIFVLYLVWKIHNDFHPSGVNLLELILFYTKEPARPKSITNNVWEAQAYAGALCSSLLFLVCGFSNVLSKHS